MLPFISSPVLPLASPPSCFPDETRLSNKSIVKMRARKTRFRFQTVSGSYWLELISTKDFRRVDHKIYGGLARHTEEQGTKAQARHSETLPSLAGEQLE